MTRPADYADDVERVLALIDRHGDVALRIIASVFETRGMLLRSVKSE